MMGVSAMSSTTAIIIPARLSSQRFPRKLLYPIAGKPLILWTAENVTHAVPEYPTYFAVEDQELVELLEGAGFNAILTGQHASGTDRIAEANKTVGADVVINIQADEPLTGARHVSKLAELMTPETSMGTLAHSIIDRATFENPNRVKVVCGRDGEALYFSRAPIPWPRDGGSESMPPMAALHLGMYAYTKPFLEAFGQLPMGELEQVEKLEQLRALENGFKIRVGLTEDPGFGVDTPEDAARLEAMLAG